MLYVGWYFKMFMSHRGFGFTDICKHFGKFQVFNMCGSRDIVSISLHQIPFVQKYI